MDVPTYEDLLLRYEVDNFCMKQTFRDEHLVEVGSQLDKWETLAWHIGIPTSEIENIKRECNNEVKGIQLLQCWKRGCGFKATYKALVILLLKINRADLAGKVVALRKSVVQRIPSPPRGVKETLQKFEKEFLDLIIFIEATLKESNVQIDTIIRRFSMLPQSIRRRFQTDENYKETKQRILDSNTVKKLFDNLTELKHWNYMMPDTLVHILEDVKNDDMHKKVDEYKDKLTAFKANTKLRELIGISFPVPDYCMELTMEVEGWEDKTIQEVENRAVNIIRRAAYSGSPRVSLGWKGVVPGCIEVSFILMESIQPSPEKLSALCEVDGVMYISIDGDVVYMEQVLILAKLINDNALSCLFSDELTGFKLDYKRYSKLCNCKQRIECPNHSP